MPLRTVIRALIPWLMCGLATACTLSHDPLLPTDSGPPARDIVDVPTCTSTSSDPFNCGACQHVCPAGANQQPTCSAGVCGTGCNVNFADCDGDPSNGCEASLLESAHCGACATRCVGAEHCGAGDGGVGCRATCESGTTDCGATCVDTNTSVMNCGGCGVVCASHPNATPACNGGVCGLACAEGMADCNGNLVDGCEVVLATDAMNCGVCGTLCTSVPNGSVTCVSAGCTVQCNPGFALMTGACVATCGNRVLDSGETCDDGNTTPLDGCDASCQTETAAAACPGLGALPITTGTEIYTGTTVGAADLDHCAGGHPGGGSPDQAYHIAVMATGTLTITVTPAAATYDAVLIVRPTCTSATDLACITRGTSPSAAASFVVTSGQSYDVIVDGEAMSSGAYTLTFAL